MKFELLTASIEFQNEKKLPESHFSLMKMNLPKFNGSFVELGLDGLAPKKGSFDLCYSKQLIEHINEYFDEMLTIKNF